jgi:hypothetical protein
MWFKGVLTRKKLGTLIDSELLIYCLQADYILSCIRVCIIKTLFSLRFTPLLLSTMDTTSPLSVALLCTVVLTAHLSVMLLCIVVATPQPSDTLWWFVYVSLQLIINQLSSPQSVVDQLSLEISGSHSELHPPSALGLPAPLVFVPVSMTHCSVVLVVSHSGTCLALVQLWICPGCYPLVN